ncbi:MAG: hypothetical protein ABIC57_01325 [bacterium]
MQNVLPVSGQNSRLFTVVTQGRVMMYFAFADYEKNTSFSKYTIQPLPSDFSITDLDDIIQDLLVTWGADIGLDLRSDSSGIVKAIFYNSSQIGGTNLVLDASYYQESYKSRILNCLATRMGDEERIDYASKYMKTFKPTDLLWVNLDWDKISVFLLSKIGSQDSPDVDVREFSIENNLTHKDAAKQLQNVVGIHLEKDSIRNILANVLYRQIMTSTSTEVWDVIRSFVTTSLIKVKDPVFKSFGMKTNDAHLMITGDIASVLSPETLFISVSDGLQLRGRYRVILDQDQVSVILGEALASKNFVLPVADLFKNRFLYISSESDVRTHEGDLSFKGKIESNQGDEGVSEKGIIGQIGYFHTFDLGGTGRIIIDPTNAVYFPNLAREGKNVIANYANNDDKLVVDCRKIPVVYGPDESSNLVRIKTWINGLKLKNM